MEEWKRDFKWLQIQHYVKDSLGKESLPDLNAVLLLIGIQEYGRIPHEFSKEEKRDLMHIAACTLMEHDGYYEFIGRDEDGWPHFENVKPFTLKGVDTQSVYLKEKIIQYFANSIETDEIN